MLLGAWFIRDLTQALGAIQKNVDTVTRQLQQTSTLLTSLDSSHWSASQIENLQSQIELLQAQLEQHEQSILELQRVTLDVD